MPLFRHIHGGVLCTHAPLLLLLMVCACTGKSTTDLSRNHASPHPPPTDMMHVPDVSPEDMSDDMSSGGPTTRVDRVRRLSHREVSRSIALWTGVTPQALSLLPPDSQGETYDRMVGTQTMSRTHLDGYMGVAAEVGQALLTERALGRVGSACAAEILPPAVAESTERVIGSSLGAGPTWAVQAPGDDPSIQHILYADNVDVSYTHRFPAAGRYRVTLTSVVGGSAQVRMESLFQGTQVHQEEDLSGMFAFTFEVEADAPGNALIDFDVARTSGNNLSLFLHHLEIQGPLDPGMESQAVERRACMASIIEKFAAQAFRRPLDTPTRDALLSLYDRHIEDGFQEATRLVFQAILAHPRFLYLQEFGSGQGGQRELDAFEVAARLSYGICELPPDASLREAAASGALLRDPEVLEAQVRRLFDLPCARETLTHFFEQWLWLDRLGGLNKDAEVFPDFNDDVRVGMREEARWLIHEMLWTREASFAELLTTRLARLHPDSAHLYDTDEGLTELGPERLGILNRTGVQAVTAGFDATTPVRRGVFVLEQVLCEHLPPPPDSLDVAPPPPDPGLTTRERWAQHSDNPACSGCHQHIDPVGFAFESFDGIGVLRTMDQGFPVDDRGGIPALGIEDGALRGGAQIAQALSSSSKATACFARQWLRFGLGRQDSVHDEDVLTKTQEQLSQGSMKEALIGLMTSSLLRQRHEVPTQEAP